MNKPPVGRPGSIGASGGGASTGTGSPRVGPIGSGAGAGGAKTRGDGDGGAVEKSFSFGDINLASPLFGMTVESKKRGALIMSAIRPWCARNAAPRWGLNVEWWTRYAMRRVKKLKKVKLFEYDNEMIDAHTSQ